MIRRAGAGDIPALTCFLAAHLDRSMFLAGNLAAHGTDDSDHPHGTTFFLRDGGPGVTGVLGCTNDGFLMCQVPGLTPTEAQGWVAALQGRRVVGMTGAADQVAVVLNALHLPPGALRLNEVQPLFALDLDRNTDGAALHDAPVTRPAERPDMSLLTDWFAAYMAETGTGSMAEARAVARSRAERALSSPDLHLLVEQDVPTAMAGINAAALGTVQVGGVYVPPALRGAGRGGRVVSGLLAARRAMGAGRAILFALSDAAATAYRRIGFRRIGDYRVTLLVAPLTIGRRA